MNANEYECAVCHGVFEKGWSDEEAEREFIATFGRKPQVGELDGIVCDDCHQKVMAAVHDNTKN